MDPVLKINFNKTPEIVAIGGTSVVFRYNRRKICKVRAIFNWENEIIGLSDGQEAFSILEKESRISERVYSAGISVPRSYGMTHFKIDGKSYPGFVSEYIPGKKLSDLGGLELDLAMSLREAELKKARELGFEPQDAGERNALYVPRRKKIYLIDLYFWRMPENNSCDENSSDSNINPCILSRQFL